MSHGGGGPPLLFKTTKKMKSKIEVREFAVTKAVEIMGAGAMVKDVVTKASEIEAYVIGEAVLPEVFEEASPMDLLNGVVSAVNATTK